MTDLHSAVRTAVDEARRQAEQQAPWPWRLNSGGDEVWAADGELVADAHALSSNQQRNTAAFIAYWHPSRALAMCDWADDVLARHTAETFGDSDLPEGLGVDRDEVWCRICRPPGYPCSDVIFAAAAFGVETGETP